MSNCSTQEDIYDPVRMAFGEAARAPVWTLKGGGSQEVKNPPGRREKKASPPPAADLMDFYCTVFVRENPEAQMSRFSALQASETPGK